MQKDFYSILEVSFNATDQEIKKAYRVKAIKYHPDKNYGNNDFTKKFLEIKEAYDTLISPEKRRLFDEEYQYRFSKAETGPENTSTKEKRNDKQGRHEEEKFKSRPHKSVYSNQDRKQQETPQSKPKRTPWGDEINEYFDFFALPKNIGKIIGGYSTIVTGTEAITLYRLILNVAKSLNTILVILGWAIFFFLLRQYWYFSLHRENATQIMLVVFTIFSLITLIWRVASRSNALSFNHLNYFIGINGFALYRCSKTKQNIVFSQEVNFNDVTELITNQGKTNNFKERWYNFYWFNLKTKEVTFQAKGKYDDHPNSILQYLQPEYWMNVEAEKAWTIYLLDNMEKKLEKYGFLEFNVFNWEKGVFTPYFQLGIGYIKFIYENEKVTYKYSNIKRIYTKGDELFIEKDNFEKTLFIFKSGNRNSIPLNNLCNKRFFIKAAEILLGYSIVE